MKSPFPGMDLYLEPYWRDVHQRLIIYACDQLQPKLPNDLRERIEERFFVEGGEEGARVVYPDAHIVERRRPSAPRGAPTNGAIAVEPLIIEVADEPVTQSFINLVMSARATASSPPSSSSAPRTSSPATGATFTRKSARR
ncbi:MAG: DUF4058 family protein [Planctomycetes bacterium]|nr:DUF4058 family protein [Planctomycetota bacterium]